MISLDEIRQLAQLARVKISPQEEEALQKDISSILEYVGQVSAVLAGESTETPLLRNVMREDVPTPTLGERDHLVGAFPEREGEYNKVRQIIQKDE